MSDTDPDVRITDFATLLRDVLGFTDDEYASLLYEKPGGRPFSTVLAPADAVTNAAKVSTTANLYFGVNPTKGPAREKDGRGKEIDVTRLTALWADIDVKPGACPSLETAHAITDELSTILGTRPSVIVESGHGLHVYWPIADGQLAGGDVGPLRALVQRWGRLVRTVAEKRGVAVIDSVFDLARMLRVPGSFNNKSLSNGQPAPPVTAYLDTGGPLTVAEVDERLTEAGFDELPGDRDAVGEEVSPPSEWLWANETLRLRGHHDRDLGHRRPEARRRAQPVVLLSAHPVGLRAPAGLHHQDRSSGRTGSFGSAAR
ncbi:MAG TPA: hypothetical protein VME67_19505 [Mycobacterium sp.]|nr:hypothetical protein [Mycobacterium sp.]HTX96844.1 hypothetical protein [Mycobacterium sp.]